MTHRYVFSTRDVAHTREALAALHMTGISTEAVSLVARSDIELDRIADSLKEADTDAIPAAMRGIGIGGATGLLAGLAAVALAPIGITIAGAVALGAVGALVGGWSSSLMGSALPDAIRQQFDEEIESGRVLVLVDVEDAAVAPMLEAMSAIGATHLEYAAPVGAK